MVVVSCRWWWHGAWPRVWLLTAPPLPSFLAASLTGQDASSPGVLPPRRTPRNRHHEIQDSDNSRRCILLTAVVVVIVVLRDGQWW